MPRRPLRELPFRSPAGGELSALFNLGPKSSAWLADAGITTRAELARLGPIEACRRVRAAGHPASLLLAYALEAALMGCHWQALPPDFRQHLRLEFAKLKREPRTPPVSKSMPPKPSPLSTDPALADRVAAYFTAKKIPFTTKRMMGGLLFMVRDKMCVAARPQRLMARIGPDAETTALKHPGCTPMDLTGRPMRGFVNITAAHLRTARQLASWLDLALAFNPLAPASARRRAKRST